MKIFFIFCLSATALISCAQKNTGPTAIHLPEKTAPSKNEAVAVFGEGCFWHTEIVFQSLVGVRDAISGYAGGKTKNPSYESIGSGETGHAETVQVFYDPSKISYQTLVAAFFASHDPTQLNRQGPDIGTQYRSIAFYNNQSEKEILEKEIARINASGKYKNKIVTQVVPASKFYPAEAYHQEYIYHNPGNSYVRNVNLPDYYHFRKEFKGPFKQ
ncbi:MAG TPA: peptide-methionine (S)-S-oxide reductase MsrA [Chitinophagaceae bacterium]|nr:peptide-methionine (S)-S-oxide reductase MsrA [Chitinophagaceae bacterium]